MVTSTEITINFDLPAALRCAAFGDIAALPDHGPGGDLVQ